MAADGVGMLVGPVLLLGLLLLGKAEAMALSARLLWCLHPHVVVLRAKVSM